MPSQIMISSALQDKLTQDAQHILLHLVLITLLLTRRMKEELHEKSFEQPLNISRIQIWSKFHL